MEWLSHWWHHDILAEGKGPLVLAFSAFVVTFLTTRTITRLIRAGRGPFRNLSDGGTHLHHSTPGTVLLITGAFTAVGADGRDPWNVVAALLVGVGASLVLDEFAMIFHLQDVYWTQEGQLSVSVVCLAAVTLGLAILGLAPSDLNHLDSTSATLRAVLAALVACHFVFVLACAAKGKYPMALMGLFFAPFAWVGAVRIARPTSIWARRLYSLHRREKAAQRAAGFDNRWGPVRRRVDDFIGGAPSQAPSAHAFTTTSEQKRGADSSPDGRIE